MVLEFYSYDDEQLAYLYTDIVNHDSILGRAKHARLDSLTGIHGYSHIGSYPGGKEALR